MRTGISTLFFLLFIPPVRAALFHPYDAMEALLSSDRQPRLLNTDDLPSLKGADPRSLLTLEGDFNRDGIEDMALSGIYNFDAEEGRYFLLVATRRNTHFKTLLVQPEKAPVFLHKPGTTGEGDPGDQAFSVSTCIDCEKGVDYYWNPEKNEFRTVEWKRKAEPLPPPPQPPEVPMEVVDQSLRVVGDLPDVKVYIAALKKLKKSFGTRVEWDGKRDDQTRVWVTIYEKEGETEALYDRILVDVEKGSVVMRSQSLKKRELKEGAGDTPR